MHVPQSAVARVELALLPNVKNQIVTPKSSPIIGLVQDAVLGSYLMSISNTKIKGEIAMDILSTTSIPISVLEKNIKKNKSYYGRELISLVIPDKLNMFKYEEISVPDENGKMVEKTVVGINIVNGKIIEGWFGKSIVGTSKNGIIHNIWEQYGPAEACKFIDNCQRLINRWLNYRGFSVGIGDLYVDDEHTNQIEEIIKNKKIEVNNIISETENNPSLMEVNYIEHVLKSHMEQISGTCTDIVRSTLKPDNNINIMVTSGSKGNKTNIYQMGCCVGQQNVEGRRPQKKIINRTLVCYAANDDSAEARGFCENSYTKGLNHKEFFFHVMAGREGSLDTAIKTAEIGYIQNKLIKFMEDVRVCYDNTIRTSSGTLLQLLYGDNAIDTPNLYDIKLNIIKMGNKDIYDNFLLDKDYCKKNNIDYKLAEKYCNKLLSLRDNIRKSQFAFSKKYHDIKESFPFHTNIDKHITIIKNNRKDKVKKDKDDTLTFDYILKKIKFILEPTVTKTFCMSEKELNNKKSIKRIDENIHKTVMKAILYEYLAPKKLLLHHNLTKSEFSKLYKLILNKHEDRLANPGEMVGNVAAQSIGEPITQMNLNTFHYAGVSSQSSETLGMAKVKEIMSNTVNLKSPSMTIYVDESANNNKILVEKLASYIKYTTLRDISIRAELYYDPISSDDDNPNLTTQIMINDNVKEFHSFDNNKYQQGNIKQMPWLLRLIIDKEKLLDDNISLLDIKSQFFTFWKNKNYDLKKSGKKLEKQIYDKIVQCSIFSNSENEDTIYLHIRADINNIDQVTLDEFKKLIIDKFCIKGIPNINKIKDIEEKNRIMFSEETGEIIKVDKNIDSDGTITTKTVLPTEYIIHTSGINMIDIRFLNMIDLTRSFCNSVPEIYATLGIEAARSALIYEFQRVFDSAGAGVGYHHLSILVDNMTSTGYIVSVDRFGMKKLDSDPISRAAFEKNVEEFSHAAIFNEKDYLNSVSSAVMIGKNVFGGTGFASYILDTDMIINSEYVEKTSEPSKLTSKNLFEDIIEEEYE